MSGEVNTSEGTPNRGMHWGLFEDAVGPILYLLSNALASRSHAALQPFGLPPGSLSVLTLIHANPGCSQTDIARITGMSKSGVVGLLDVLEREGLASRERAEDDRRRHELTLTAKGADQLQTMVAVQIAQEEAIRNELSSEELRQFVQMLRRVYAAVANDPVT